MATFQARNIFRDLWSELRRLAERKTTERRELAERLSWRKRKEDWSPFVTSRFCYTKTSFFPPPSSEHQLQETGISREVGCPGFNFRTYYEKENHEHSSEPRSILAYWPSKGLDWVTECVPVIGTDIFATIDWRRRAEKAQALVSKS